MDNAPPSPLWFITGASSGLGEAIAREALSRGFRVVVTSRDHGRLAGFAGEAGATPLALDVTDANSRRAAMDRLLGDLGVPDVLVNNAGEAYLAAFEQTPEAEERRQMELHFHGPLALIRATLPGMRERGSGVVVNIGAAAGVINYPGFSVYGAAKAALELASDALRRETEAFGVRVVTVHPGPFRTAFARRCLERMPRALPAYDRTVGRFARLLTSLEGKQPGDPAAAARVIVDAAIAAQPPALLPLGRYMAAKYASRAAELTAAATAAGNTVTEFTPAAG